MHYDPIKRTLGGFFNRSSFLRKLFYRLLDLLLLRSWHIHRELKIWTKTKSANTNILDAGAGFGQYTYYLSRLEPNWNILAVDVKQEQIDDCNLFFKKIGKKNVEFMYADLTKFKMENTFDLVLSVDVMEHILEDVQVFKNFHTSLKQGGMLLISTPSDQGGSDAHGEEDGSFIEEHVRNGYNAGEIKDKLESAGFTKTEVLYSYGAPGKVSWRLSMKYPIQLLGVSKLFFILLPFYYLVVFPISCVLNYMDTNSVHKTGTGLIVKAWK